MNELVFGSEERRMQLETWTRGELVDAVLTLEAELRERPMVNRAVVCTRQGPHRMEFSVGFENGELFDVVRQAVVARRARPTADESLDLAQSIHEYIHHYLVGATLEWTKAQNHSVCNHGRLA